MKAVLEDYVAVWNCPDPGRRAELLAGCWAPEATYTDPTVHLCGAAALDQHVTRKLAQRRDAVVELVGDVRAHHSWASFAWRVRVADAVLVSGIDCVEFAPDGRLNRVIGFFDPA